MYKIAKFHLFVTILIIKVVTWMTALIHRGGSRAAATSKMERFVIIVNGFQPLTIITKRSILDLAAVLDPPLIHIFKSWTCKFCSDNR